MTLNNPSTVRPVAVLELPLAACFNLRVRASDKKAIEVRLASLCQIALARQKMPSNALLFVLALMNG